MEKEQQDKDKNVKTVENKEQTKEEPGLGIHVSETVATGDKLR